MPKRRMPRHVVTQPLDKPYRLIPLTQDQNAIVDTEDFERVNQWNWYAWWNPSTKSYYALRRPDWTSPRWRMEKFIMPPPRGKRIDHIDHNTLDNRKQNLRPATRSQNGMNRGVPKNSTSGFKGVHFHKRDQRWIAHIGIWKNKKKFKKFLGRFNDAKEAARAYDAAALKYFGEFAHLNFPVGKGVPLI